MNPRIKSLIGDISPLEDPLVAEDSRMTEDLGFDSFRLLELVAMLEEVFDFRFDDDVIVLENFRTPRDIECIVTQSGVNARACPGWLTGIMDGCRAQGCATATSTRHRNRNSATWHRRHDCGVESGRWTYD